MNRSEKRNALLCIVGESLWGFQGALIAPMTMLTLVLRHYGAGPRMIGAVTAIESGCMVLPQVIGLHWFRTHGARKGPIVRWHLFTIIPAIALYGVIVLALDGRVAPATIRWSILLDFAAFIICIGVVVGAWMDWTARLFHKGIRGSIMGMTFFGSALAATLGGAIAGRVLQCFPGIRTYGWIFLAAAAVATLSIVQFFMIRDPPLDDAARTPSWHDLLERFRISLQNLNFRRYLISRLLTTLGFCIGPFVAVYFQSLAGGGLPDGTVVLCGTACTLAAALSSVVFGRLGDRHGHRIGILVGGAMQVLTLGVLALGHGLGACVLAYAGMGICAGIGTISHSNMLFETCPHDHRLAHITVGNLVSALPFFAAPLLAGWLAEVRGLPVLFLTSLAVSLGALLWTALLVREPRVIVVTESAP